MRTIILKGAVIALFLTGTTMSIFAQPQGGGKHNKRAKVQCENFIPDLTEDQEQAIEKLKTSHLKKANAFRADLKVLKAELNKLELAENPDRKKINSKIDEVFVLKAKMAKEASNHRQEVRSLLTEDQRVIFDAHARKRHKGGFGHGPHAMHAKANKTNYNR